MQFLRQLLEDSALYGDETVVGEVLTACDAVLIRDAQADTEWIEWLVCAANLRLREIAAERAEWQRSG